VTRAGGAPAVLPVLPHKRSVRRVLVLEFAIHLVQQVTCPGRALVEFRHLLRERPLPTACLHLRHSLPYGFGKACAFILGCDGAREPHRSQLSSRILGGLDVGEIFFF